MGNQNQKNCKMSSKTKDQLLIDMDQKYCKAEHDINNAKREQEKLMRIENLKVENELRKIRANEENKYKGMFKAFESIFDNDILKTDKKTINEMKYRHALDAQIAENRRFKDNERLKAVQLDKLVACLMRATIIEHAKLMSSKSK